MGKLSSVLVIIFALFVTHTLAQTQNERFRRARRPHEKLTQFAFYVRPGGPDGYQVTVASAANVTRPPNLFGLVNVADYALTVGPSPTSAVVGRAHGLFASASSMTDFSLFTGITIVLQTGRYNGSSVNIIGYDPTGVDVRDLPIIGGTGAFLLARGSVNFAHYHGHPAANYTIERLTVTILHY